MLRKINLIKEIMNRRNLFGSWAGAVLVSLFSIPAAQSQQVPELSQVERAPAPLSVVTWSSGLTLTACLTGATRSCQVVTMPKQVGAVHELVLGEFVTGVRASWLALSMDRANLCALAPGWGRWKILYRCPR